MSERELISWTCPICDKVNVDLQDDYTHCGNCGEVVWVCDVDESFDDQNWKVDMTEYKAGG